MKSLVAMLVCVLSGLRARWVGTDPVEKQRVYFANHTSNLDAAVLWASLPPSIREKTRPVAAKDYWSGSALRRWLAHDVFRALLMSVGKSPQRTTPCAR